MEFFKKLADDAKKKAQAKPGGGGGADGKFKNPFGGGGRNKKNFRGGGQTLGGSKPGSVITITFPHPGPLGVKVEKRPNSQGTAIVASVVPNSQASEAGLQRGDILCFPDSDGAEEIMYDQFLQMASSDMRPLIIDVRRVEPLAGARDSQPGFAGTSSSSGRSSRNSADAFAKRQAVIAAAEARDKAHKAKTKPVPKGSRNDNLPTILSTAEKRRMEEERERQSRIPPEDAAMSEEARRAVAAAKADEAAHSALLGYNPYETAKMSAGQAKTATVAMTHGSVDAGTPAAPKSDSSGAPRTVATPPNPVAPAGSSSNASPPTSAHTGPIDPAFDDAFMTVITTNDTEATKKSLGIMHKLIVNAITKGRQTSAASAPGEDDPTAKFRRVRLSNPKIADAIAHTSGALELMLSVGFVLSESEDDGETYLVFPPGLGEGPHWLQTAIGRMKEYEQGS